jgi:hypothetical protein
MTLAPVPPVEDPLDPLDEGDRVERGRADRPGVAQLYRP